MQPYRNTIFFGRNKESESLKEWNKERSKLTVIYGRRRIGKSRLIEESLGDAITLKCEGLENQSTSHQQQLFMETIAVTFSKTSLLNLTVKKWRNILLLLSEQLNEKPAVVVLDEFQWLAANQQKLVSELKYIWDNYFLKNNKVHLILCGSIASFMVKKVVRSKALFGRIDQVINLKPLSFKEVWNGFLKPYTFKDALTLYLTFGGVPKYLELCDTNKSYLQNIKAITLNSNSPLLHETEAIFISNLGKNKSYRKITELLAMNGPKRRIEIAEMLKLDQNGDLTDILEDLSMAGIIEEYEKINTKNTKNKKFRIKDNYLGFYFRFVKPNLKKIEGDKYQKIEEILRTAEYQSWLGIQFERFCIDNEHLIASELGFNSIDYSYGSFYQVSGQKVKDIQQLEIDLVFDRSDGIISVCEIKFGKNIGKEDFVKLGKKCEIYQNMVKKRVVPVMIMAEELGSGGIEAMRQIGANVVYMDRVVGN